MIFQHSQCFQCFQCSKKRGTPLKNPPLLRTQFAPNTAQGAHKFHKGETARQGRQHSAGGAHKLHKGETGTVQGERTSSTRATQHGRCDSTVQGSAQAPQGGKTRQERQLRKAGTRAAGSQKLRLWRSLFWKPMTKLSLSVARYAFICSSSLRISRASNHVPMIDMIISINTISPAINQNVKVVNTASIYFSSLILITALGLFFCVMLYLLLVSSL